MLAGGARAGLRIPPWRLRDLQGRDRRLAISMFILLLVPFGVALLHAHRDGWLPSGDEANIATRAFDVFSRHPPLTGLPSTSSLYGDKISTNHPGPIEFYLLAVPLRVFGMAAGPLLTAAGINAACVLIAAWVFFRRLGLTAMLWAGVLLLAVMWSGGTAVLTDTLSSNMTMYSLLCVAVLTWALIDGDLRLLPLAALFAGYAAQQHLAAGFIVLALVSVAIVALAVQIVMRIRRGDPTVKKEALRWSAAGVAVAAVCWTPVIIDQLSGHPGNLTAIMRFARDNSRATLGFQSGFYQAVHAVTPPTILGRTDTTGAFFLKDPAALTVFVGLLVIVGLGLLVWRARVEAPAVARLAVVAFVVLIAGIVDGSNVPRGGAVLLVARDVNGRTVVHGVEAERINLYRWTWVAAFLALAALGIGVAFLVGRAFGRTSRARRAARLGPLALLVTAALIATAIVVVNGPDDHNREQPEFAIEKRIADAVLAKIDHDQPVLVYGVGNDANLSIAPHLIARLVEAGVKVEVQDYLASTYGTTRKYEPGSASIVISSGHVVQPSGPGELIAIRPFGPKRTARYDALSAERTALLDELSAAALGKAVVFAPGAAARIDRQYPGLSGYIVKSQFVNMAKYPRTAFGDPEVLHLILDGVLSSPVVDHAKVRRVLDLPMYRYTGTWGDEQIQVHLLSPEQTVACSKRPCFSSD